MTPVVTEECYRSWFRCAVAGTYDLTDARGRFIGWVLCGFFPRGGRARRLELERHTLGRAQTQPSRTPLPRCFAQWTHGGHDAPTGIALRRLSDPVTEDDARALHCAAVLDAEGGIADMLHDPEEVYADHLKAHGAPAPDHNAQDAMPPEFYAAWLRWLWLDDRLPQGGSLVYYRLNHASGKITDWRISLTEKGIRVWDGVNSPTFHARSTQPEGF